MEMVPLSLCGLLLILPLTTLAQNRPPLCTLPDTDNGDIVDEYNVRPFLMCTDNGLNVQLSYEYPEGYDLFDSRIQLFYECHSPSGNVINGPVPNSAYTVLDDFVFTVPLNSTFTNLSTSCEVWGCYQESTILSNGLFTINNGSCVFEAPTTEPTVEPTTVPSTTNAPLVTPLDMTSNPHSSISIPIPSPTGTVPAPTGTTPIPTTIPLPTDPTTNSLVVPTAVIVVVIFVLAVVCVLVLVGIIVRFHQVQRKKNYLMRYYNYSEPIDPYFSPIDINAKVKMAVSLVSVFDTFIPNSTPPDSTDDDRSEVLQGTMNPSSDDSSVTSIKFVDQATVIKNTDVNSNKMEPPPPETAKEKQGPSVDDLKNEPISPHESGYVPSDYQPVKGNPGYVIGNFQPSTIPVQQGVQKQQQHGNYVQHADMACTAPRTLYWNQNGGPKPNQFRTQLSSSASSGYVTDLSSPTSDYYKVLTPSEPEVSLATRKHLPPHLLQTGYPKFDSTQPIDEVLCEEDADSVVYSLDEGDEVEECDAIGGVTEQKYVESVFAECSLSLNPSHFEPINYDELVESTSPSYVNTTPGAELYHSQVNEAY